MVYKVIGLMSGSSLDGLDIVFTELQEIAGKWFYKILCADCNTYKDDLKNKLKDAHKLNAFQYQLLHVEYGHYTGTQVNNFIEKNNLQHQVHLVVSHGHTVFHTPEKLMTSQLGDGAAIAAETRMPVVTDLRAMDVALGGQGAPIVPIGEALLFADHDLCLNLGGIANISGKIKNTNGEDVIIAFDICAANRVLNMLAQEKQLSYDEDGKIASSGKLHLQLLQKLNDMDYYKKPYPKSLSNDFGTDIVFPLIKSFSINTEDAAHTYVEHIVSQIKNSIIKFKLPASGADLFITGGGVHNTFLLSRLQHALATLQITITVPDQTIIDYKEALIVALVGTLRWREEYTVINSVTGASRNSIGGALWLGTEA